MPAVTRSKPAKLVLSWVEQSYAVEISRTNVIPTGAILQLLERASIHEVKLSPLFLLDIASLQVSTNLLPVAILDINNTFWRTVLNEGGDGFLGAASLEPQEGLLTINLRPPTPEACVQDAHLAEAASHFTPSERHTVHDPRSGLSCRIAVRRTIHDGTVGERTCATIYLLPGLGGTEVQRLNDSSFLFGIDRLVREWDVPLLLVSIDTSAPFGTHYISDRSEYDGRLRLFSQCLVDHIDSVFPTARRAEARVLAGHSSGGLNAMQIAMRGPGVFGTVLASAPDALDLSSWLLDTEGSVKAPLRNWMRVEDELGGAGQMLSYARSWATHEAAQLAWPCDLDTGRLHVGVFSDWRKADAANVLAGQAAQNALRSLHGRLVIGAARNDEFELFEPTVQFISRLDHLLIPHRFVPDVAGHFDGSERLVRLLEVARAYTHFNVR